MTEGKCVNGHKLHGENIDYQKSGDGHWCLVCRQCNKERAKAWRIVNAKYLIRKKPKPGRQKPGSTINWE